MINKTCYAINDNNLNLSVDALITAVNARVFNIISISNIKALEKEELNG